MMKIMEMHAQNVICGPQKKKIRKKSFLAKLFTKNQKSIPNLPQVTLPSVIYDPVEEKNVDISLDYLEF